MALKGFINSFSERVKDIANQVSRISTLDLYTALEQLEIVEKRLDSLSDELDDINNEVTKLDDSNILAFAPEDEVLN